MPGMDRRTLCCLAVLLSPAPALAQAGATQLTYATYIAGLNMADVDASIALSPQGYRVQIAYRLTGVVGALVHGGGASAVDGRFQADSAVPREFVSTGQFRGRPYVMRMQWRGGQPTVLQLEPPDEDVREPVPAEQQAHTIDTLSAMASLLQKIGATGRCDGGLHTFDGRRLSELQARTVGEESLPETGRSSFKGTALRCDFEGRQLAGFLRDADQAALRRVQHGSAWFARVVPGGPVVPVRITFSAQSFGEATMYLAGP